MTAPAAWSAGRVSMRQQAELFCLLFCDRTSTGWTSKDCSYVGKRIRGNTRPGNGSRGPAAFRCRFHAAFAAQSFLLVPPPGQGLVSPVPAGRAFGQYRLGPGVSAGRPQGGPDGQRAVSSPAGRALQPDVALHPAAVRQPQLCPDPAGAGSSGGGRGGRIRSQYRAGSG